MRLRRAFVAQLLSTIVLSNHSLAQSKTTSYFDVHRERRLVYDATTVHFGRIVLSGQDGTIHRGENWILARVEPGANSGRIEGLLKGPIATPEELAKPVEQIYDGKIKVGAWLAKPHGQDVWDYRWEKRGRRFGPLIGFPSGPDNSKSPFTKPGVIICNIDESATDLIQRFFPLYLIPPDWEKFVVPAYEFFKANAADLASPDAGRVQDWLKSDNPFVALWAWKIGLQLFDVDPALSVKYLKRTADYQKSASIFGLLAFSSEKSLPDALKIVRERVDEAQSDRELRDLTLGIYTAYTQPLRRNASRSTHFRELLEYIHQARSLRKVDPIINEHLRLILSWAGIDKSAPPSAMKKDQATTSK